MTTSVSHIQSGEKSLAAEQAYIGHNSDLGKHAHTNFLNAAHKEAAGHYDGNLQSAAHSQISDKPMGMTGSSRAEPGNYDHILLYLVFLVMFLIMFIQSWKQRRRHERAELSDKSTLKTGILYTVLEWSDYVLGFVQLGLLIWMSINGDRRQKQKAGEANTA